MKIANINVIPPSIPSGKKGNKNFAAMPHARQNKTETHDFSEQKLNK